jgi:hypothetical protein
MNIQAAIIQAPDTPISKEQVEKYVAVVLEAKIEAAEEELECVRAGGHDDVGILPNTTTGGTCKFELKSKKEQPNAE